MGLQRGVQARLEGRVDQLARADVDGQPERLVLPPPVGQLPAGPVQRPVADLAEQAQVLGQREQLARPAPGRAWGAARPAGPRRRPDARRAARRSAGSAGPARRGRRRRAGPAPGWTGAAAGPPSPRRTTRRRRAGRTGPTRRARAARRITSSMSVVRGEVGQPGPRGQVRDRAGRRVRRGQRVEQLAGEQVGADRAAAGQHREPGLAQPGRHVRAVHPVRSRRAASTTTTSARSGPCTSPIAVSPPSSMTIMRAGVRDRLAGPAQALPVGQAGLLVEVGRLLQGLLQVALVADVADVHHQGAARFGRVGAAGRPLGLPPPAEAVAQPDRDAVAGVRRARRRSARSGRRAPRRPASGWTSADAGRPRTS